ncbi:hypothetical protein JCM16303_004406 [Sporobolomyces ruberrimus]
MGSHVSTVPQDAPKAVLELDRQIQIAKFVAVSTLSVAAYDHLACLEEEIELIWKADRSIFKYLALVSRYSGLLYAVTQAVLRLGNWSHRECIRFLPYQVVVGDFGEPELCRFVVLLRSLPQHPTEP